jgi:hypothetical protein
VEPLDWNGTGWTATLEVRLRVDAAEHQSQGFNDRSYAAGSAERCLRVAFGGSSGNNADEISCRGRVGKPIPPPKSLPGLDDGAPARLASALRADSFATARQRAEKSFSAFAVEAEIIDGVWAISVIAPGNDCIGGTRRPDGRVEVTRPPRVMRQPGEGGCNPNWFVHPVHTH